MKLLKGQWRGLQTENRRPLSRCPHLTLPKWQIGHFPLKNCFFYFSWDKNSILVRIVSLYVKANRDFFYRSQEEEMDSFLHCSHVFFVTTNVFLNYIGANSLKC